MAKVGNETELILILAAERMEAERLDWIRRQSNPNANSNNPAWMMGYEAALREFNAMLTSIVAELEQR